MTYPMPWVKLERYAEITGDSAESVKIRLKAGRWLHGDQCKIVDGEVAHP